MRWLVSRCQALVQPSVRRAFSIKCYVRQLERLQAHFPRALQTGHFPASTDYGSLASDFTPICRENWEDLRHVLMEGNVAILGICFLSYLLATTPQASMRLVMMQENWGNRNAQELGRTATPPAGVSFSKLFETFRIRQVTRWHGWCSSWLDIPKSSRRSRSIDFCVSQSMPWTCIWRITLSLSLSVSMLLVTRGSRPSYLHVKISPGNLAGRGRWLLCISKWPGSNLSGHCAQDKP